MMDGITVLNATEMSIMQPGWNWGTTVFAAIIIIGIILFATAIYIDDDQLGTFAVAAILIGFFFGVLTFQFGVEVGKYNQYDVLINDSVSMVEFNKEYEIVDQNGLIYTIKERDK